MAATYGCSCFLSCRKMGEFQCIRHSHPPGVAFPVRAIPEDDKCVWLAADLRTPGGLSYAAGCVGPFPLQWEGAGVMIPGALPHAGTERDHSERGDPCALCSVPRFSVRNSDRFEGAVTKGGHQLMGEDCTAFPLI